MSSSEPPLTLTKFERANLIAARAEQLQNGSHPFVDVPPDATLTSIAELEIERRALPVRIARRLPNGKVAVYALDQFAEPSTK